jgi:type I restriction enzyme S subunit
VCTDFIVPMRDRPKVFDGEIPWCRIEDIQRFDLHTSRSGLFVSELVIRQMNLKVMPAGTVIASCSASLGRYAIASQPLVTNQTFIGLVCGPAVYNRFLLHVLHTKTDELAFVSNTATVAYIPRRRFEELMIPVPPLEVQRAIVRILDNFTELEAELEAKLQAELQARRRQYAHYRDHLMTFSHAERVMWVTLGDLGRFYGGLTGKSKSDFVGGNAPYVSYMNVYNNIATEIEPKTTVRVSENERQNRVHRGDLLFTGSSETPAECGMSSVVTSEPPTPLYLNSFCIGIRPHEGMDLEPNFAKHLLRSASIRKQIVRTASGVTRFNVSKVRLAKVVVPIPTRDEQLRLAFMLDKFDALVNNLSIALPAELAARPKQYEHYRDRLLTFEEAA